MYGTSFLLMLVIYSSVIIDEIELRLFVNQKHVFEYTFKTNHEIIFIYL